MAFYKDAAHAEAHVEILDPFDSHHREIMERLSFDSSARDRVVARLFPFTSAGSTAAEFRLSLPVEIHKFKLDNVLDLRRPAALEWLWRTVPNLHVVLNEAGERYPCLPNRPELGSLGEMLPSLLDQSRGGGNFDKIVGLYLRHHDVAGLVFPAVRGDAHVMVKGGEPTDFSGWSIVAYADAPKPDLVSFFELRPDWPRTLVIEGGDDHVPNLAAFADEFHIVMTEDFPSDDGGFAIRGIAQRMRAFDLMDSFEAAIRFRMPHVGDEQIMAFKEFAISMSASDCVGLTGIALWCLLGNEQAHIDLQRAINETLSTHPVASLLTGCLAPPGPLLNQTAEVWGNLFSRLYQRDEQ